ncbi:hypothetical protein GOB13_21740 [Sinorhizobium meliloti]|uniref:hypothetical protein n=1 Tax=Rhizobium meliloti TaxID=382 RepID=UPI000B49BB8B|nr:hypothetical protein [Sinorhizobium meliloti]ASQ04090.1 hypothetical protein CDO23_09145 [Sinorhizobium meliloti]MDW9519683.1 hypothetical protein [Sinorhizobium meliloti]MDW9634150.1 hypothetical protein [Sinorhizobium meliloti]MDW9844643.1 hypothetical protein [Sinorhizobium meliloti]MDX0008830.1 hypothetical protein [Sinorhizobium meliloti]
MSTDTNDVQTQAIAPASKAAEKRRAKKRLAWWPLDGATTIAVIALMISLTQMTVPNSLLQGFWFGPNLSISEHRIVDGTHSFGVFNSGNGDARNVEVVLLDAVPSSVRVFPGLGAEVTTAGEGNDLTHRILVPRLGAGDFFIINIERDENYLENLKKMAEANGKEFDMRPIMDSAPTVFVFRSDEGAGNMPPVPADHD